MTSDQGDSTSGQLLVTEVFSAIQGEAALVGERQVFLRLTGCNIRCAYCDQPEALERRPGPCRLERTPGRRDWEQRQSPLGVDDVVESVDRLWRALPHHSVSLTGGEPLMQSRSLERLLPLLVARGHRVMAETNGVLVGGLRRTLPWLAYVSMDIKLDSVDGEHIDLDTHRRFLAAASDANTTTWLKIVVGARVDLGELDAAIAMVADCAPGSEVFLQPVTPFAAVTEAPTPDQVLELQARAHRRDPHGRV
ncbi:MAG: 7-carboxy-7-deazaguanine synthase, partial [Acidimicrobiaceae bacterium]|nr:7-carboxy-7-deazaguanine synthase [Acidimicrobiaceae bacterium]